MPRNHCPQLIAPDNSFKPNLCLSQKNVSSLWVNLVFHSKGFLSCIYLTDNCIWQFDQLFLDPLQQNSCISIKRLRNVFAYLQSINFVLWTRSSDQLRRIITLEKYPWKCHWVSRKWNYHPVMNELDNAVITQVLSWKIKFSVNGRLSSRKSRPKFIFKNDNYYQWPFILRGSSLDINFFGVNYPESNYPKMGGVIFPEGNYSQSGRQLSGEQLSEWYKTGTIKIFNIWWFLFFFL